MINVISQSTSERRDEVRRNFEKVRPYLDEGVNYALACEKVGLCTSRKNASCFAWFKELVEYGESQGYPYKNFSGKR